MPRALYPEMRRVMRAPPKPRPVASTDDDVTDSTPTMAASPDTQALPTPQVDPGSITTQTVNKVTPESFAPETLVQGGASPSSRDSEPRTLAVSPSPIAAPPSSVTENRQDETLARIAPEEREEETLARIDRAALDLVVDSEPADDETLARITRPDDPPVLAKASPALLVPPKLAPPRAGGAAAGPKAPQRPATPPRPITPAAAPAAKPALESVSSIRVLPAAEVSATSIGKYRLLAEIGEGGMAHVFLAMSTGLGDFEKLVVIKQLREELGEDPSFVQMFLDEARLAARLNHPNVVQTHEVVSDGRRHLIVMEYLEGVPYVRLARSKDRVSAPLALHVRILCDALYGLHYAHELRDFDGADLHVVHRDVSPQNLMLTYNGGVKVLDFGIAKAAFAVEQRPDDFKGKLEYMAPEQARMEDVDRRADIFCVGIMLWEAIARRRMYVRGEDKYARLVGGQLPSLREVRPDAPTRLEKICARALAHDREARYATAQDMANDLEEYLESTTQHVTSRDLGSYVSEKFARSREKMLAAVEAQQRAIRSGEVQPAGAGLSRLPDVGSESELPPALSDPPPPLDAPFAGPPLPAHAPLPPGMTPPPPYAAASQPYGFDAPAGAASGPSLPPAAFGAMPQAPPTTQGGGGRSILVVLTMVTAAIVIAAVVALYVRARGGHDPAVAKRSAKGVAAEPSTPASGAPSAGPAAGRGGGPADPIAAEIEYTIKASPVSAKIYLDGEPRPGNPATGRAPRDGKPHAIRVEADGFVPKEETVTFDRSVLLSLELHPRDDKTRDDKTTSASTSNLRGTSKPPPAVPVATRPPTQTPAGPTKAPPRRGKKLDLDPDNPYGK